MISNIHTHTNFCDGDNSPEEMVIDAINNGFSSLGFSGHAFTDFDTSFCIKDTTGYIKEVKRLKDKYKSKIQIYLGLEEDYLCPVKDRKDFDFIITSAHYVKIHNDYLTVDYDFETLSKGIQLCGNEIEFAEKYYQNFTDYILAKKPNIIGHFDLLTKFEEENTVFLKNEDYYKIAEKYLKISLSSSPFFEVNTGAISRGYRTTPYPDEKLLYVIKKNDGKIILNSDSHSIGTLDNKFEETKKFLKDIGFEYTYILYNNEFIKDFL